MESTLWDTFFLLGQQAFQRGDLEQAQEAFSAAVSESQSSGLPPSTLALSLNNLAAVLHRRGALEPAIDCSERALQAYGGQGADGEMGVGLVNLAELYMLAGRMSDAESALLSAEDKLARAGDEESRRAQKDRLGQLYLQQEKLPQAIEVYRRSLEELARLEPEPEEDVARTHHVLSNLYEALDQPELAEASRQQCLKRLRKAWAEFPEALGEVLVNMAESLAVAGRVGQSVGLLEEAVNFLGQADFETLAPVQIFQLAALRDSGQAGRAVELGQVLLEQWDSPQHLARLNNELGLCYFLHKDFGSAVASFSQALQGPLAGSDVNFRISTLYNLAAAQQGGFLLSEAASSYSLALSLAQEYLPPGHGLTARIVWNYSGLLEQLGQTDRAHALKKQFGSAL